MRRLTAILALLAGSVQAQTISIPAQTACSTIPAQTVCVTLPARTLPVTNTPPTPPVCVLPQVLINGVCVTPAPPPPPSGVKWMYLNGVKTLAGDFTGSGEATNYQNLTTAGFNGDTRDILITSSVPWGYFIPYWSADYKLPNPGYTNLLLSLKPTITGDTFGIHAERVGDVGLSSIELLKYGPPCVAGKWASYVIPLKDLGVYGDATLYKVVLGTHTNGPDAFELDAIGFQ